MTGNYNNYSAEELDKALQSWVEPYPKPIILNHDLNTEPIGRVMAAKMDQEADGSKFVRLQIAITDPVAAQKVMDKRYLTGSVGGRAGKAICSISGEDLAKEDASGRPKISKYKRGQVYKGKVAYIEMQELSFKEYSFVNQPADQRSSVRSKAPASGDVKVNDSDWVARSSAFILSMDEEEVYSVSESKSLFAGMKKKESRPVYLQLKGAFLSAMAVQEGDNYIIEDSALLSSRQDSKNNEENSEMTVLIEEEDILAVANELSDDLSSIAADALNKEEVVVEQEVVEADSEDSNATAEVVADAEESKEISVEDADKSDVQEEAKSEKAEESTESPDVTQEEEVQPIEDQELKDETIVDVVEQNDDLFDKVALLEEENKNLKSALHRVLSERVVDAKIAAGVEAIENRDDLIKDHSQRTAASLADSLRDIAKMPVKKFSSNQVPEITSEAEGSKEEANVLSLEKETAKVEIPEVDLAEQLFVDAFMGRRKL